jgi:hypothetical protein
VTDFISTLLGVFVKAGITVLVANEVRGLALAGPVFYGMYQAGGTAMALWIGFCSLMGIAISVVAPLWLVKRLKLLPTRQG